jgi:hypothetical protein
MPNHIRALIVTTILLLTSAASADDVTVTWSAPEQTMFDTMCEELRISRPDPEAPWGDKRCLGRFAKKGMRSFRREQSYERHTIDSKFQIQQDMIDFDGVFPEEN